MRVLKPKEQTDARTDTAAPVADPRGSTPLREWLAAVPILWLVLVASAYALLALYPFANTRAQVPGIAEAEQAVPGLLAALVAAAIMWYFSAPGRRQRDGSRLPRTQGRQDDL